MTAAICGLLALTASGLGLRPRFGLLSGEPVVIRLHLYLAGAAFALGLFVLAARKGSPFHRIAGWAWVLMIGGAILASFFILKQDPGRFSWIHVSSVLHGVTLMLGVTFAKLHAVKWHARMMVLTYVSGLIGAGLLAFIPDRLMWRMFFGL